MYYKLLLSRFKTGIDVFLIDTFLRKMFHRSDPGSKTESHAWMTKLLEIYSVIKPCTLKTNKTKYVTSKSSSFHVAKYNECF